MAASTTSACYRDDTCDACPASTTLTPQSCVPSRAAGHVCGRGICYHDVRREEFESTVECTCRRSSFSRIAMVSVPRYTAPCGLSWLLSFDNRRASRLSNARHRLPRTACVGLRFPSQCCACASPLIRRPDDEDIDSKILQAVQARLPAEVPPEELSTAETSKER